LFCEFEIVHTSVSYVLKIWCGLFWVVLVLQAEAQLFCSRVMWGLGVNDSLK